MNLVRYIQEKEEEHQDNILLEEKYFPNFMYSTNKKMKIFAHFLSIKYPFLRKKMPLLSD